MRRWISIRRRRQPGLTAIAPIIALAKDLWLFETNGTDGRREDRDCGPARWCGNLRPAIDRQISAPVSLLRREDRGDARGMSEREIHGHLREIHGIAVAPDLIGTITDVRPDTTKEVLGLSWRAKRSW